MSSEIEAAAPSYQHLKDEHSEFCQATIRVIGETVRKPTLLPVSDTRRENTNAQFNALDRDGAALESGNSRSSMAQPAA